MFKKRKKEGFTAKEIKKGKKKKTMQTNNLEA
jgi:hypothetical protein